MIESDSDQVSVDSNDSLISVGSKVSDREKQQRLHVMMNLLPDAELRNENCGLVRLN